MSYDNDNTNIAETLARVLPQAKIEASTVDQSLLLATLPQGQKVEQIDLEKLLPSPRRKTGTASLTDADSFIAYVAKHAKEGTTVWAKFNPQSFDLSFTAVIDEFGANAPAWRDHRATFKPTLAHEWNTWKNKDGHKFDQVAFGEFLETNSTDIVSQDGYPTDLQMLEMATNFVATQDSIFKSATRLQSGGVNMSYVADANAETVEAMKIFEKFALGIPVFQGGGAWGLFARLKYRLGQGKVTFHYELIRPDRVHELAAKKLIDTIRDGLAASNVPLLLGTF